MSIKYAILGFLSWTPLTGYDLKKLFEEAAVFHWSGNNNQIYKALVELHNDDLVTLEIQPQADRPPRKIYTITERGMAALRAWLLSAPELPQVKQTFLVQLAWADQLSPPELAALLNQYDEELRVQLLMFQTHRERGRVSPRRTTREAYLWDMLMDNWIAYYENERRWLERLRAGLASLPPEGEP